MLIKAIRIRNFRSLQDFEAALQKFTVIIGENDVGKTSVLYALNAFFANKKLTSDSDFFRWQTDAPISVELIICGLPESLSAKEFLTQEGTVTVRRIFEYNKEPVTVALGPNGIEKTLSKTAAASLFPDEAFHFVPVRRSLEEQFSMKKTALLGKTFRALMKKTLAEPVYKQSQAEIGSAIESSIDPARLALEQLMKEQLNNQSIGLSFPNLKIDPIEGVSFDVTISDEKMSDIPLDQRGAGTQNSMILALYRFIASKVSDDFILALEEPENSFHPKGQRELLSALHRLSERAQVICTSHSPVFIDRVDFRSNVILVRKPDGAAVAKSLDPRRFQDVRQLLGIRPSDALLKGGGNCGIIAEGKSEESAFPQFMKLCGISDRELGISVLPLGGSDAESVRRYIRLLDSYGLPCCVVLDGDIPLKEVEDLKRILREGVYPMFKFLHVLENGSLEDYYPHDLMAEGLSKAIDGRIDAAEIEIFPDLKGRNRLERIRGTLHQKGIPSSTDFLKLQLSDTVPVWMVERKYGLCPELTTLFGSVKEVAVM